MSLADTEMKTNKTNTPLCDCLPLSERVSLAIHGGEPVLIMSKKDAQARSEYYRHYREKNRKVILQKKKEYREKNSKLLAEKQREYTQKNKELVVIRRRLFQIENSNRLAKKLRERYANNKDKYIQKSKEFREKNQEKVATWQRNYQQKNSDKIKESQKQWRSTPSGKAARFASESKRRARKMSALINNGSEIKAWAKSWKSLEFVNCHWCGCVITPNECHADHVMPLSKGGAHCVANLVISCQPCNNRKKDKHPDKWIKEISKTK